MTDKGFETGNVVPITVGRVTSSWVEMPSEVNQRTKRGYTCMDVGQADASWSAYLKAADQEKRQAVSANLKAVLERHKNRS